MDSEAETKYCSNCKRDIAVANYVMHEVHCARNIVLCKHCEEPVPRSELEDHFEEYHAKVDCPNCKDPVEKDQLEDHEKNQCPKRLVRCPYCELDVHECESAEHFDACGVRTEPCTVCGRRIMKKDFHQHEATKCVYPPKEPTVNPEPNSRGAYSQMQNDITALINMSSSRPMPNTFERKRKNMANKNTEKLKPRSNRTVASRSNVLEPKIRNQDREARRAIRGDSAFQDLDLRPVQGDDGEILDPDHALAMHLAGDLRLNNDYAMFDNSSGLLPRPDVPRSNFEDEEDQEKTGVNMLPCEFCEELFPFDALIMHQSVCTSDLGSLDYDSNNGAFDIIPNNSPTHLAPLSVSSGLPIFDNLHSRRSPPPSQFEIEDLEETSEDTSNTLLLPCEFCDEPYPLDMLLAHQMDCECNDPSPPYEPPKDAKVKRPSKKSTLSSPSPSSSRARRHQGLPFGDVQDAGTSRRTSDVHGNKKRSPRSQGHLRVTVGNKSPTGLGSVSSKYVNKLNLSSQPRDRNARGFADPSPGDGEARVQQRRLGSATKVRDTLDKFVNNDSYPRGFAVNELRDEREGSSGRRRNNLRDHRGASGGQKVLNSRRDNSLTKTYQPDFLNGPRRSSKPRTVQNQLFDPNLDELTISGPKVDNSSSRSPAGYTGTNSRSAAGSSGTNSRNGPKKQPTRPRRQPQGDV